MDTARTPPPPTHVDTHASRLRRAGYCLLALTMLATLAGCASGGTLGKVTNKALEAVGIKDAPPVGPQPVVVPMRLYAGDNLNAGTDGRPLALVVKVYHLRSSQRFEQVTYETFLDDQREREALGADLIAVHEIVLTPGMRHVTDETLPAEATAVGVVALFRAPASNRWRLSFDPRHVDAGKNGIMIGLHACALSTSSAALTTRLPMEATSLASVQCQRSGR